MPETVRIGILNDMSDGPPGVGDVTEWLGRLVAEGLARATDFTRDGVRLGFGIQDRGALHGRYLVVRQWLGGKTVEAKT